MKVATLNLVNPDSRAHNEPEKEANRVVGWIEELRYALERIRISTAGITENRELSFKSTTGSNSLNTTTIESERNCPNDSKQLWLASKRLMASVSHIPLATRSTDASSANSLSTTA